MNPTIQTNDGHYFNLITPNPGALSINGIAHALSHLCRFTGHVSQFYSVSQHSLMVSLLVPSEIAREGLLHDAAEAYIGDVSTPLKQLLPDYRAIEHKLESVIADRFDLEWTPMTKRLVKKADLIMLATECRDLFARLDGKQEEWACLSGIKPLEQVIYPMPPEKAKRAFLQRAEELGLI